MGEAEIGAEERAERAAQNQALFRAIDERINDSSWDVVPEPLEPHVAVDRWICECANVGCFDRIALSAIEYEHVRAVGWRFAVAPGELHVDPDIETVTDRQEAFWTVEKSGAARSIAVDLYTPRGQG